MKKYDEARKPRQHAGPYPVRAQDTTMDPEKKRVLQDVLSDSFSGGGWINQKQKGKPMKK